MGEMKSEIVPTRDEDLGGYDIAVIYGSTREVVGHVRRNDVLLCWYFYTYSSNTRGIPSVNSLDVERYKSEPEAIDAARAFMTEATPKKSEGA